MPRSSHPPASPAPPRARSPGSLRSLWTATGLSLVLALACGGSMSSGPAEHVGIAAWQAPDGAVVDVVAELRSVHRRGGPGIGCVSSEALVTPELRRYDAADLVEPALYLRVRGRPGLESHRIYQPGVPMQSREQALADARAQVLVHCFSADGRRLALRWEPPGTDPSLPGLWPWQVAALGPSPAWLEPAPAERSCAQAAAAR